MTEKTEKFTTHFFDADKLPAEPAIPDFKIRFYSQMAKMQSTFVRAGVTFFTGKKSLFMSAPTNDQKIKLKREGVDPYTSQKKCSPRKP